MHGDHAEIEMDRHQHEQCADAGRGQGGQNGDRMDRALVEHAEDDVDGDQRGDDQDRLARERGRKALALPWKVVTSEAGLPLSCSICWMAPTASPSATPASD